MLRLAKGDCSFSMCTSQGSTRIEQVPTSILDVNKDHALRNSLSDRYTWNPFCEFSRERVSGIAYSLFLTCNRVPCSYYRWAGQLLGSGGSSTFPFIFRPEWSG